VSDTQSGQSLAEQHAEAAAYVRRLCGSPFRDRLPALSPTAQTGGHVADGGTHGGGSTCG
jgi:hypothetical protein